MAKKGEIVKKNSQRSPVKVALSSSATSKKKVAGSDATKSSSAKKNPTKKINQPNLVNVKALKIKSPQIKSSETKSAETKSQKVTSLKVTALKVTALKVKSLKVKSSASVKAKRSAGEVVKESPSIAIKRQQEGSGVEGAKKGGALGLSFSSDLAKAVRSKMGTEPLIQPKSSIKKKGKSDMKQQVEDGVDVKRVAVSQGVDNRAPMNKGAIDQGGVAQAIENSVIAKEIKMDIDNNTVFKKESFVEQKTGSLIEDALIEKQVADTFRRWGYLQAELDTFHRIKPFPHRDLDNAPLASQKKWRDIYCSKIGVEFMHIPFPERTDWIARKMEARYEEKQSKQLSADDSIISNERILKLLLSTDSLEKYIYSRYIGVIWFALDGLSSAVPMVDQMFTSAAESGAESAMVVMAHRGRITGVHHFANVPLPQVFAAFEDPDPRSLLGGGDTKYHLGATGEYVTATGRSLKVHISSNPSHLESANPVIMGRTRAKQERYQDSEGKRFIPIIFHGDAAFGGQGITAESLNFSELNGFNIGGTVHIILNNMVGFTATPEALHSSRYCTDVAKRLSVPIFHVNAESFEDVCFVGKLAMEYRQKFGTDVVIDLIGYRRYGHNETDDPTTLAPLLYDQIKNRPQAYKIFAEQSGISAEELQRLEKERLEFIKSEHELGRAVSKKPQFYALPEYWSNYCGGPYRSDYDVETGVTRDVVEYISKAVSTPPEGFNVHTKMKSLLESRAAMGRGEKLVDWGMAEMLAFGSLLIQGYPVRIAGQDSRRGTFSHRQSVLVDSVNGEEYYPLKNLTPNQAKFSIYDSMLSEAAALGYEFGFSRDYPEALVCWEAQFGDFVNGAQIIIDQYISASEDKWGLLSGVTMLLPHGFEGRGAEHSSARLERFLQLCAEDNMQVCYPSTAAQNFHLLRRQVLSPWRKPLVVLTPKSMLRAAPASSLIDEFLISPDHKVGFKKIILDDPKYFSATRVIFCSGKIVHELKAEREKRGANVGIIPIEQIYPFPEEEIRSALKCYQDLSSLSWVQEEPANMGALSFVKPRLEQFVKGKKVHTIKRAESASPATGSTKAHLIEQNTLINHAFMGY